MANDIEDVEGPSDDELDEELEAAGLSITDVTATVALDDGDLNDDFDDDEEEEEEQPPKKPANARKSKNAADDDEDDEDEDEVEDDLDKILDERLHPDRADAEEEDDEDEGTTNTSVLASATDEKVILCQECFTSVRSSQLDMRSGDPACPNCGLPIKT